MLMKRAYWNRIADDYETEIFNVLKQDRQGLVLNTVERYARRTATASDLGCGIGNLIPALSAQFNHVIAVDFSSKCIARARAKCSALTNVSYLTADLAKPRVRLPNVDFALSVNAILTSSLARRNRIFDVVCRHVRPGGHLVLAVPSLESACLTDFRRIEWNLKSGVAPAVAARAGFRARRRTKNPRRHEGIVRIDGVDTKHYLKEELVVLLRNRRMEVLEIQKIRYSWKTEFAVPPRWMKEPFPWDWLCVAKKIG